MIYLFVQPASMASATALMIAFVMGQGGTSLYIPGYLSKLGMIAPMEEGTLQILKMLGDSVLTFALIMGAVIVISSLKKGIREHRKSQATVVYAGVSD